MASASSRPEGKLDKCVTPRAAMMRDSTSERFALEKISTIYFRKDLVFDLPFRFDSFQQFFCRLVGGVLGDELAGEGAGEEGRRQFVHLLARLRQPLLQLVGLREQARHSPHDFMLLESGIHYDRDFRYVIISSGRLPISV